MKIVVSACLLGENCKYSGGNNYTPAVEAFVKGKDIIPVCPERLAGLGIPREPIEIVNGRLEDRWGNSVDGILRETVAELVEGLLLEDIECAVLQSRSPTCGVNQIYDGTFSGKLVYGSGVFAESLRQAGIRVIDAQDLTGGTNHEL